MRKDDTMPKDQKPVISYHTFVFPFLWDDSATVTRARFEKKLIKGTHWKKDILNPDSIPIPGTYAQQQYFNHAGKNTMFTYEDDPSAAVHNYRYDLGMLVGDKDWFASAKGSDNKFRLVLEKESISFKASLCVNGLRLKLFNTGVGLLVYELENYELSGEKQVRLINEFGRRLFMPYSAGGACKECADRVSLCVGGMPLLTSVISGGKLPAIDTVPLPETVLFFLRSEKHAATTRPKHERNELFIEPIIDDRMFTLCYYVDKDFVADMSQWDGEKGCYAYLSQAKTQPACCREGLAQRLYMFMFIDSDTFTCPSRQVLAELLEKSIYTRWLENTMDVEGKPQCAGTITGITACSMVCVSTGTFVADTAFLIEYVEMALLVLAQRASLLNFEKQISESAKGKASIGKVQKSHVLFHGQMLLREVTPQQQGIELYDMLQEKLMIRQEAEEIAAQLDAMFSLEQNRQESNESMLLNILAALSVFEACAFLSEPASKLWLWGAVGAAVLLVLLMIFIGRRKRIK